MITPEDDMEVLNEFEFVEIEAIKNYCGPEMDALPWTTRTSFLYARMSSDEIQ